MTLNTADKIKKFEDFLDGVPFAGCGGDTFEVDAEGIDIRLTRRCGGSWTEELIVPRSKLGLTRTMDTGTAFLWAIKQRRPDDKGPVIPDSSGFRYVTFLCPQWDETAEPSNITRLDELTDEHYLSPIWIDELWPQKQLA